MFTRPHYNGLEFNVLSCNIDIIGSTIFKRDLLDNFYECYKNENLLIRRRY